VGLEDRDWYREEPSAAWKADRRDSRPGGIHTVASGSRVTPGAWLAILVTAASSFLVWQFDLLNRVLPFEAPATAPAVLSRDDHVVRLRHRPGLDLPVTKVTSWSLSDPRFGTVTVLVPIGRTPRDALAVALAQRGFQVVG